MKSKGFTLIELLIVFCMIAIVASAIFGMSMGCKVDKVKAERLAAEFAKNIPGATGKVSCMGRDSDGDGYCRCNIFKTDGIQVADCDCQKFCFCECSDDCSPIEVIKGAGGKGTRNLNIKTC